MWSDLARYPKEHDSVLENLREDRREPDPVLTGRGEQIPEGWAADRRGAAILRVHSAVTFHAAEREPAKAAGLLDLPEDGSDDRAALSGVVGRPGRPHRGGLPVRRDVVSRR